MLIAYFDFRRPSNDNKKVIRLSSARDGSGCAFAMWVSVGRLGWVSKDVIAFPSYIKDADDWIYC